MLPTLALLLLRMQLVRGDHFVIADRDNGCLQLCSAEAPGAPCQTIGSGLVSPRSVAVDNSGDYVVADEHKIKRCSSGSPEALCETVVGFDQYGDSATELSSPQGVFWDAWRFYVVADTWNNRVQRCVAGILHARCHTVAEDLHRPFAVVMDHNGDYVIADTYNNRVRLCDAESYSCRTAAGYGPREVGTSEADELFYPRGLAIDEDGRYVIADTYNHRIQRCTAFVSLCDTMAGTTAVSGSRATELSRPNDVALDADRNYLIADSGNHRIQLCSAFAPGSPCQTVAGSGSGGSGPTELSWPNGVALVAPRTTSTSEKTMSSTTTSSTTPSTSSGAAGIAHVSGGLRISVLCELAFVVLVLCFV